MGAGADRYREALGTRRRVFIPDAGGDPVEAEAVRNPPRGATFGWVGAHAEVKGERAAGVLVLAVDARARGTVAPESIRLFRWDADGRRYAPVAESGGSAGELVWGRIDGAGRYAAIGVEADPAVVATIRTLAALRDLPGLDEPERKALHERVCRLLLCEPDETSRCADCRALAHPFDLPELELLPLLARVERGPREAPPPPLEADALPADGVSAIALDPTEHGRLYVAAADGGMWRLDGLAGGTASWEALETLGARILHAVAVAPSEPEVVYAADDGGRVMRSPDRGETWSGPGEMRFRHVWRVVVHPSDPDGVYVASGAATDRGVEGELGLWRSGDGGETWTKLLAGDTVDAAVDPDDGAILYAAVRGEGLFMPTPEERMKQDEDPWTLAMPFVSAHVHGGSMIRVALGGATAGPGRTVVVRLGQELFVNRFGGRPRRWEDGGPWISIGKQGGNGTDGRQVVAVDPFDDDVLLTGGERIMRTATASAPAGGEWARVVAAPRRKAGAQALEFDRLREGVVYHASAGGIQRSTDAGRTWAPIGAG
jgi:hypothetical protein